MESEGLCKPTQLHEADWKHDPHATCIPWSIAPRLSKFRLVEELLNIWFWVIIKFACLCLLHLDFIVPNQCFPDSLSIFESQVSSLGTRLASSWHFLIATHGLWCRRPLEAQLCKSLLSYQSLPGGRAMARWWWVQCRVLATVQIWTTEIALFIQHYSVTFFSNFL